MSKLSGLAYQFGSDPTATNNFVITANNDGTLKLARGILGATTQDVLTVDVNGRCTWTQGINATVSASTTNTVTNKVALNINGTVYYLLASTSGA